MSPMGSLIGSLINSWHALFSHLLAHLLDTRAMIYQRFACGPVAQLVRAHP